MRKFKLLIVAALSAVISLRCASVAEKCLSNRQFECAALNAASDLRSRPNCCGCREIFAEATRHLALAAFDPLRIDHLQTNLEAAGTVLREGGKCMRRKRYALLSTAIDQIATDVAEDRLPLLWNAAVSPDDPDARIRLVMNHLSKFGTTCRHDAEGEFRKFLGFLASGLGSDAIRSRIPLLGNTGAAVDAHKIYQKVLFRELVAANDPILWKKHREDFAGTSVYFEIDERVDRGLLTRAFASTDADEVERTCAEILGPDLRASCEEHFVEMALRAAEERPTAGSIGRAKRACEGRRCARQATVIAFRFAADESYRAIERDSRLPKLVKRSAIVWSRWTAMMDEVALTMLGRGASLRQFEPRLHGLALAQIQKAKHDSRAGFARANREWTGTRKQINRWYRPNLIFRSQWIGEIDHQLKLCVDALQLDESNRGAARLIQELIGEREKLSDKSDFQLKVVKRAISLIADVAVGELGLPRRIKYVISVGYSLLE